MCVSFLERIPIGRRDVRRLLKDRICHSSFDCIIYQLVFWQTILAMDQCDVWTVVNDGADADQNDCKEATAYNRLLSFICNIDPSWCLFIFIILWKWSATCYRNNFIFPGPHLFFCLNTTNKRSHIRWGLYFLYIYLKISPVVFYWRECVVTYLLLFNHSIWPFYMSAHMAAPGNFFISRLIYY